MNLMVKISQKKIPSKVFFLAAIFWAFFSFPSFAAAKKTLIFCSSADAVILNPILYTDTASGGPIGLIFNGLVKVNENLEIVPDLAEKFKVSPDGQEWTFYLRKNVFWHDGVPFTSEDVKFTFDKILDPRTNTVRRGDFIIDGRPIIFKTDGPYIFKAILPESFAPFLVSMSMGILPKHLLEPEDINHADFNRAPVGTGPFKFGRWRPADHLKLVAFEKYFLGRPKIDEIVIRVIPNPASRLAALELGEVDDDTISGFDLKKIQNNPRINIYEYQVLAYTFLGLNLNNDFFKDVRVRQALAMAIDRAALIKNILLGHGQPCYSPAVSASWAYSEKVKKYPYAPERALKILNSCGWQKGADGLLQKNGQKFEFTALVNLGNREREKAAIIIQSQLAKIGVKMNIQIMEWASLLKILMGPVPKKFDAVFLGWSLGLDPDDYTIWHSSQYPAGFNFIGFYNKKVDRLLEQGRLVLDRAKRQKIYEQFYQLISEETPYLFLWNANAIEAVNKKIKGLSRPGPAGLFLNIEKIELEP